MNESERESWVVAELTEIQSPLRLYVQSLLPGDPAARDVAQHANATIWRKRGVDLQLGFAGARRASLRRAQSQRQHGCICSRLGGADGR